MPRKPSPKSSLNPEPPKHIPVPTVRMAFYGSLRPKCYNFERMGLTADMVVADDVTFNGVKVINVDGKGYPHAVYDSKSSTIVTVVDVPHNKACSIGDMECGAGYAPYGFNTQHGTVIVWLAHPRVLESKHTIVSNWYDHPSSGVK